MAGSLGSSSFDLVADDSQLLAALIQSKAAADNYFQATAAAAKTQAEVLRQSNETIKQALSQVAAEQALVAQGMAQMAAQAQQRYQQMADAAKSAVAPVQAVGQSTKASGSSFDVSAGSALKFAGALTGVTIGLHLVHDVFVDVIDQTTKAEQAQFSLNAVYGESAATVKAFAEQQRALGSEFSAVQYEQAAVKLAAFNDEGHLTVAQDEELLKRAGDLAAAFGKDLPEALNALEQGLKGRGLSLTQFGVVINESVIKQYGGLTEAQKANYASLSESTKIQAAYRAELALSAQYAGQAKDHTDTLTGAQHNLSSSLAALEVQFGDQLAPSIIKSDNALAGFIDTIKNFIAARQAAELDAEQGHIPSALGQSALPSAQQAAATGPLLGPAPRDVAAIQKQLQDETDEEIKIQGRALIEALQAGHDARIKELDDQKTTLEAERDARLRALEANKTAALDNIREMAEISKQASEAEIAQLRVEEDAKKKSVETTRQATLDGLDAEKAAVDLAAAENIRQLEVQQDHAIKAANAQRDAEIAALDETKRARDLVRTQEDRALADSTEAAKRQETGRHQAVIGGLDDESKAITRNKESADRALEDQGKKAQSGHDAKIRLLDDEGKKAQANHDAATRSLDDEAKAEQKAHDARSRQLSDELDAAQKAHDVRDRQLSDELQAAQDAHDAEIKRISDIVDAAQSAHDTEMRRISDESDAEAKAHQQVLRGLSDEQDARLGVLDTQLKALDAEQKQADNADRLAGLQRKVGDAQTALAAAQGTGTADEVAGARQTLTSALRIGDPEAIKKAEQDLADLAGHGTDAIKKAQQDLADSQKALLNEQTKEARDAQKTQITDQEDTIKKEISARKVAEDDAYQALQDQTKAEQRAADDQLTRVKTGAAAEKRAADDKLDLVQRQVSADKRANDDQWAATKDRIAKEKQINDDAFTAYKDHLADQKQELDDALTLAKGRIDQEKTAEDDKLAKVKDNLDKRKRAVDDTAQDELDKVAARKLAESKLHDDNVILAQDEATKKQRAIADVRTAEDTADGLQRTQANTERDEEIARIKAKYSDEETGAIPALHRVTAQADIEYEAQKKKVQDTATAEIEAITAVYTTPGKTGLIDLAEKAEAENATRFQNMARDVTASAAAQKQAIEDIYHNAAKTGLLDQLDNLKAATDAALKADKLIWDDYIKGLTGEGGTIPKGWADAQNAFDAYMKHVREELAKPLPSAGGGSSGGGSGSGSGSGGGGSGGGGGAPFDGSGGIGPGPGGLPGIGATGNVETWLKQAIQITGVGDNWLDPLTRLVGLESSGNPNAVNPKGVGPGGTGPHAKGLLQVIDPTFAAERDKSLPNDIFNPVANAVASINHIEHAWGHPGSPWDIPGLTDGGTFGGYANGGWIPDPTILVRASTMQPYAVAGEAGPEWVGPVGSTPNSRGAGTAPDNDALATAIADKLGPVIARTRPIIQQGTAEDLVRQTRRVLERNARDYESLRGVRP